MENLDQRIEKLNHIRRINFYIVVTIISFLFGLTIWAMSQANSKGEMALLLYIFINALISLFWAFKFLRVKTKDKFKGDLKNYYDTQIAKSIFANEYAVFIFLLPVAIGMIGIWVIDYSNDNETIYWIYITIFFMMTFIAYRWWIMREFLRKQHRDLHNIDFFSFFHF